MLLVLGTVFATEIPESEAPATATRDESSEEKPKS
jgi:hypothetical protein